MPNAESLPNTDQTTDPVADSYIPGGEFGGNGVLPSPRLPVEEAPDRTDVVPPVLVIAVPKPTNARFGTLFWLPHTLGLDIYGASTLSYAARADMNAAALILSTIFLFDLGAWGLLFYFIFNSGSLGFRFFGIPFAFVGILPALALLLYERGFMTADTKGYGWKRLIIPTAIRLCIIVCAAWITAQPVELLAFGQRIVRRINEELVRKDIVSHYRKLTEAREAESKLGASEMLAPHDEQRLADAERDLTTQKDRLVEAEVDLAGRKAALQSASIRLQEARSRLSSSGLTRASNPGAYAILDKEVQAATQKLNQSAIRVREAEGVVNVLKVSIGQAADDIPTLKSAWDADLTKKAAREDEEKLTIWVNKLRGADPGRDFPEAGTDQETGYQFRFVDYDFLDKFRVLDDILQGRPPRWPGASDTMVLDLKKQYGMYDDSDDNSEAARDRQTAETRNAWRAYLSVFGVAIIIPLLSLLFKLIMPAQLSYYYSSAWQSKQGHPEAMAFEAAVYSMGVSQHTANVIELSKRTGSSSNSKPHTET